MNRWKQILPANSLGFVSVIRRSRIFIFQVDGWGHFFLETFENQVVDVTSTCEVQNVDLSIGIASQVTM